MSSSMLTSGLLVLVPYDRLQRLSYHRFEAVANDAHGGCNPSRTGLSHAYIPQEAGGEKRERE